MAMTFRELTWMPSGTTRSAPGSSCGAGVPRRDARLGRQAVMRGDRDAAGKRINNLVLRCMRVARCSANRATGVIFSGQVQEPMSSSVVVSQSGRDVPSPARAEAREGWVQRRVALAWYLLVLNCLTYSPGGLLHLPSAGGKAITQGALYAALFVALTVNRRIILRPNVFLCLVSLLILGALITIIATPVLRYCVPDIQADDFHRRPLAAYTLVESTRPAARPLPPESAIGGARHRAGSA